MSLVAAIDLGGTKIRSLVVESSGTILGVDQRPTEAEAGIEAVIERMVDSVRSAFTLSGRASSAAVGVGVSAPGPVDFDDGILLEGPNLPGWIDVRLGQILAEQLGMPAFLENDANAAAFGEHRYGAGRGTRHMIYLTISTGIGGGLILDGKLYRGADGTAGELGHVVVDERGPLDDCGMHGCLESLASGTAIARMAREALERGQSEALRRLAATSELTAREVNLAADDGDPTAREILARASHYLAIGLANFINIFNPELIVIGGGAANIRADLVEPAFAEARALAFARPAATAHWRPAALGADSGALGVAALTFEAMGHQLVVAP